MGFLRALQLVEEQEETKLSEGSNHFMDSNNNNINKGSNQTRELEQQHHNIHHRLQLEDHHHHQLVPYGSITQSSPENFRSKDGSGAYDLGELDQAVFLYFDGHDPSTVQDQRQSCGMRPPTLNIFPSQPMHVEPSTTTASRVVNISPATATSGPKRPPEPPSMELTTARHDTIGPGSRPEPAKNIKREGTRKGPTTSSLEKEAPKTPDPKTLRRLAQNREAARKSRLRKKAYVQQLESSRIKLAQLEQELQRARSQGMFFGGGAVLGGDHQGLPVSINNISSEAAVFDMEYARWVDEHNRLVCELRAAVQEHIPESELRLFVENCITHYDEVINMKSMVAKTDVFHIISGMWKTPAERCFMWMGGFRPSDLIKIVLGQIEPLTEQQILGICGLQQTTQETEEALSQGLEALNQSISETLTSDSLSIPLNIPNYMGQMALAINKLSTLEGFVRQADNVRHQTIHRLYQILTTRQAARYMLAIAEYFHRLRALNSLWLARPRQE